MRGALLAFLAAGCLAPEPEPEPTGPPEPVDLAAVCEAQPLAALVRWRSAGLDVAGGRLDVIAVRPAGDVVLRAVDLGGAPVYDARWIELEDAGTYAFAVELLDSAGQTVGLGRTGPVAIAEPENPLRFLDLGGDLGLAEPIGLRLLLAFPRRDAAAGGDTALRDSVERFSENVLQEAVGPTYPVDVDGLLAVERARDLLLDAEEGTHGDLPHALGAQALAVVDLDQAHGRAQLGLRLFDVSYRRYQREQPERRLWNTRLLVFEDHVELDAAGLAEGRTLQVLLAAWSELLGELVRDPRARAYRDFVRGSAGGALWTADRQQELLRLLGLELPDAGPDAFAVVESRLLFPAEPAAPVEAASPREADPGSERP